MKKKTRHRLGKIFVNYLSDNIQNIKKHSNIRKTDNPIKKKVLKIFEPTTKKDIQIANEYMTSTQHHQS